MTTHRSNYISCESERDSLSSRKRLFDLAILLLTAPLWIPAVGVISVLVWANLGRPIFFRHARPGFRGRSFELVKFRTMTEERDAEGHLLPDRQRLTSFGDWLRSNSLDELPELLNVLKGEMSLVGPRPLLIQYLERYSPEQARRHDVLPGMTGWAQINGRNDLAWEDRFRLDVWYVDHYSLWLDARILFLTLRTVFRRDGINAAGRTLDDQYLGAAEFMGSPAPRQPAAETANAQEPTALHLEHSPPAQIEPDGDRRRPRSEPAPD